MLGLAALHRQGTTGLRAGPPLWGRAVGRAMMYLPLAQPQSRLASPRGGSKASSGGPDHQFRLPPAA